MRYVAVARPNVVRVARARSGFRAARPTSSTAKEGQALVAKRVFRYAVAALVVVLGILALRFSLSVYRVASPSMEPALHCAAGPGCRRLTGDIVVINRLAYSLSSPKRGDVVALRPPTNAPAACRAPGIRLKRVAGLPHEVIGRRAGGETTSRSSAVRVPPNHYFLLSDNPRGACDSRDVGPIPRANIAGKVVLIYSPPWRLRGL